MNYEKDNANLTDLPNEYDGDNLSIGRLLFHDGREISYSLLNVCRLPSTPISNACDSFPSLVLHLVYNFKKSFAHIAIVIFLWYLNRSYFSNISILLNFHRFNYICSAEFKKGYKKFLTPPPLHPILFSQFHAFGQS